MTGGTGERSVCGASAFLPGALVPDVLALETSTERPAVPGDVQRHLRCTLERHAPGSDHYALLMELDGPDTGSVWTTWPSSGQAEQWPLLVLPDCPGADDQPCNEFAEHSGGHTHEVHDPWSEVSHTLSS
jgi:hypothetical protein